MIKDILENNQNVKANSHKMEALREHFAGCFTSDGAFDMERWNFVLDNIRTRAGASGVSDAVISDTLRSPAFIPSIVKSDRNQAEFKLTLDKYLERTVNDKRIKNGRKMRHT